jgi:hypothetical protein
MTVRRKTRIRKRKQKRVRSRTRKLRGGTVHDNVKKAQNAAPKPEPPSKEVTFYNRYHLGDNILNLKFLYNISSVLKEKKIKVKYLYNPNEISRTDELERYIDPAAVELRAIENNIPSPGAIELWMGNPIVGLPNMWDLDLYFPKHYAMILDKLGLADSGIDTSLYQKEPYLEDIYKKLDPKYKDLEILIINAEPKSFQVVYHKALFEQMCIRLAKKYKVAVTSPIEGEDSIPCTFKDKLMLQDIAAISTHAKYIVGIHSGPVTACFTDATKKSVKKWVLFADNGTIHSQTNIEVLPNHYDYKLIEEHLK